MSNRIGLLRLDYIFSVVTPMLIAIYLNGLNPLDHIDIIVGFAMLAITGNTWNDLIDMKDPNEKETLQRVEGYHPREIFTIGLSTFVLGVVLLLRTCFAYWINAIFLVIIIAMVLGYCVWFKPVPILNHILLGASHIVLPYFMIKIDAAGIAPWGYLYLSSDEWILMFAFFFFAITGEFVHEVIDGDSLRKHLSLRQCQIVIWIFSILTLCFALFAFFTVLWTAIYFLPLLFFPIGIMFTFRRPTESTKGVKDAGILMGNFLMIFFMCLIILRLRGIIVAF